MSPSLRDLYRRRAPENIRTPLLKLRRNLQAFRIRRLQGELLKESYPALSKRLIVVLVPGRNAHYGGILAANAFYEETRKLKHLHHAETVMCTVPSEPLLLKYTWFENNNYLFGFSQTLRYFHELEYLLIHIPEYAVGRFLSALTSSDRTRLRTIGALHVNILIQNIELFNRRVKPDDIKRLQTLGKVTCTTAHERYCTREMRETLGVPVHQLSTYVTPELYERRVYAEKENLIVISHDQHPRKNEIIALLKSQLPQLRIQIVHNLSYAEFKKLVARAKWTLTFGEGLDGYFVETIFSGGISFAVYHPSFFTDDFRSLSTIYASYDDLSRRVSADLKRLDHARVFAAYQKEEFDLCHKYYNYAAYLRQVDLFYKGEYTFD